MDPSWGGCIPEEYGVFDPPKTLDKASAMVSPESGVQSYPTAAPGSPMVTLYAPATPTPDPKSPNQDDTQPDSQSNPLAADSRSSSKPAPSSTVADAPNPNQATPPDHASDPLRSLSPDESYQGQTGEDGNINSESDRSDPDGDPVTSPKRRSTAAEFHGPALSFLTATPSGMSTLAPSDRATLQFLDPSTDPPMIAGQSLSQAPNGGVIIGSTSIAPGSQVAIAGHTISAGLSNILIDNDPYILLPGVEQLFGLATILPAKASIVSNDGSTSTFSATADLTYSKGSDNQEASDTAPTPSETSGSVFQIDGQDYTAAPTDFTIAGQTVAIEGPAAVMIDGTLVSLKPTKVRIDSSIMPFGVETTHQVSLGGLIISGFDAGSSTTNVAGNGSTVMAFTGGNPGMRYTLTNDNGVKFIFFTGMFIGVVAYVL